MTGWIDSDTISGMVAGQTVTTQFLDTVRGRPNAVALRWKDGDTWNEWTWADYADQAARVAAGLAALGVGHGDRIVLLMRNIVEFHLVDMAALLLGATPISIYNTSSVEEIEFLMSDCGAVLAVVEDAGYLDKMLEAKASLPALREIVMIEGVAPAGVHALDELLASDPVDLEAAVKIAQPDDLATVIYTSGTTGPPKGVMLDHANIVWTAECLYLAFDNDEVGLRLVSYLPMAHVAERMNSHYLAIRQGFEITACPVSAEIVQYLPQVKPQIFFGVPRIYEKAYALIEALAGADPVAKEQFDAAIDTGWKASEYRARGEEVPADLAEKLRAVDPQLAGIRSLVGLDECVTAVSGAAPLNPEVFRFFRGLGVPLSEIYGLSETSGPMTWTPDRVRINTVGPPVPGVEVKLANDGEVLCRGGNIFRGYLGAPEKTAEAMDGDWFRSGDIGVIDDDGYLRIIDRKKELIITAGGKNISPANLESALKGDRLIGQACVIGDQRPYLVALLVLDPEIAPGWAARNGLGGKSLAGLADDPAVVAEVQRGVDRVNAQVARVEQIKRFKLLGDEWLPDSEELTPTMKLKRRGVLTKYADEIAALYS
ncbi:MAG: Long-chain-fatty-acid--CoA ligase [Actinomycetia bacterium]|nr:Long-chain-fatty-acid--CoA ligase [Actinomycetes bacterium]